MDGDADCLPFQDLPSNRTVPLSKATGTSVHRAPSDHANGRTRDPTGRLVTCSQRGRCPYRTGLDGRVTVLVDRQAGKRLCGDVRVDEHGNVWSSAADRVHCLSPDGTPLGKVRLPYRVSNVAFGGRHRNRPFIDASNALHAVFPNVRGAPFPPGSPA